MEGINPKILIFHGKIFITDKLLNKIYCFQERLDCNQNEKSMNPKMQNQIFKNILEKKCLKNLDCRLEIFLKKTIFWVVSLFIHNAFEKFRHRTERDKQKLKNI